MKAINKMANGKLDSDMDENNCLCVASRDSPELTILDIDVQVVFSGMVHLLILDS